MSFVGKNLGRHATISRIQNEDAYRGEPVLIYQQEEAVFFDDPDLTWFLEEAAAVLRGDYEPLFLHKPPAIFNQAVVENVVE